MAALSGFVLRHKLAVALFWLAVLAAGAVASARLGGRLSGQFALPSAPGYQAGQQILRLYGNGGPGYPEVVVVRLPPPVQRALTAARPRACYLAGKNARRMAVIAGLLPPAAQDALRRRLARQPAPGSKATRTAPRPVAAR